jgi:long-chain-fatty-acid---luciferin-component ligase
MVFPYDIERKASHKVVKEFVQSVGNPVWLNALVFGVEKAMANARWNPIDDWAYHPDPWHCSIEEIRQRQLDTIRCAFRHHYSNCVEYHRICQSQGVTPEDIKREIDLLKIPLLTSDFFKNNSILSVPEDDICAVLTTSGTTSANPSRIPKDFLSLKRQQAVIERIISTYLVRKARYLAYFAPPPNEATIWMSLVPYIPLVGYATDFYMRDGKFSTPDVFERMRFARFRAWTPGLIAGFHFFYKKLMDYTKETGEELPMKGADWEVVITTGGWKNLKNEMIAKDKFQIMLSNYFDLPLSRVRDGYGFGEANIAAFECGYHNGLHVDPHTLVSIRDPKDVDEELPPGEDGIIAVYDPTMNSFPAFVLTDDVGHIEDLHECECTANTQKIWLTGRAPKSEMRSCGLKLEQTMEVIGSPEMKERFTRINGKARYFDLTRI